MAKRSASSIWKLRLPVEERNFKNWSELFLCKQLEDYWEGKHWQQIGISRSNYKPFVLNLVYSTIKIKLANIIYQNPKFNLTPKPGHGDWNGELASRAANIKGAALNTLIQNPKAYFVKNLRLAALDSFFYFGVVESGYAADWQNPLKVPLLTDADLDPDSNKSLEDTKVISDEEVPVNERLYWKHIKARRFRVGSEDSVILDHSNWCGYYSFFRKSVLAKTKGIDLPTEIKNEYFSAGFGNKWIKRYSNDKDGVALLDSNAYVKVWTLFDNQTKKKQLVIEDDAYSIIWEAPFERYPFSTITWDERAPSKDNLGWYPMPPVFQWTSTQDEINQSREQLRNFRNRATRKFWYNKNVEPDEVQKLSNNVDGEAIKLKGTAVGEQSLGVIQNAEPGTSLIDALKISTEDLNLITATSANTREVSDRTTATESKIIDVRSQIRESVEQMDFSAFVCDLAREGLLVMHERFTEGMWIKLTLDPNEQFGDELQDSQEVYDYIQNQEIIDGSYDWDVDLDVQNGTPAQMQDEADKFVKFTTLVMSNPQFALSPVLIRECAAKIGYKNEKVIRELQKAATFKMIQMMQMGQQGQGGITPNNGSQASMDGNASPSPGNEMVSQLRQQVGK